MSDNEDDLLMQAAVVLNPEDLDEAREEATHALITMMMHETDIDLKANRKKGMHEEDCFAAALSDNMKVAIGAAFMIGVAYQEMRQHHNTGRDRAG